MMALLEESVKLGCFEAFWYYVRDIGITSLEQITL